jgi:hypothetical protein
MKGFALVALFASLVGACGDDRRGLGGPGGSGGSNAPDGGSGAPDGGSGAPDGGMQAPPRVTIATGQPPALIVYREETDTAWKTPASPSTGTFEIEVSGPYRVIVVCAGSSGNAFVAQFAQTLDDDHRIEQLCGSPHQFPFHVRGQMQQSGLVDFGEFGRGQTAAPWSFDLLSDAGTFDFLAFFGDLSTGLDHVEIRRDIAITGDLDLGTIDATQDPTQALVPTRFTASNLDPAESLSSDLFLQSGDTSAIISSFEHPELAWQVNLVPGTALRATDTQDLLLSASSASSDPAMQQRMRSITRRIRDGGSTAVVLMDPLGPTAFESTADRLVATWTSLPEYDAIDLGRASFSSDFSHFVDHEFLLSRAFITSTGATAATLDFTDVPGFQPAWRHDPTLEQQFFLDAFRGTSPDDPLVSEVSEDVPAPTPPGAAPRRIDPQRAPTQINAHRIRLERARQAARRGAR